MRIALYGLPCAGKTTILSSLKNVRVVNGSQELNKMSGQTKGCISEKERKVNALALRAEEGRDYLR